MSDVIVTEIADKSVERKIAATAQSLKNKYNKQRIIKESKLKEKSKPRKVLSIIFDVFCTILVIFTAILCFSSINCKLQGIAPSFGGVSNLTIKTGSMVNSGLNIGSTVIVRSVNTDTLNENDIIAFYVYPEDYKSFNINTCIKVEQSVKNEYVFNIKSLFGFHSNAIKIAGKAGAELVIHHIKEIYEDENGVRWFRTYGSSNINSATGETITDTWFISENMVLGLYDDSAGAKFFATIVNAVSSKYGLLIVFVPIILITLIIVAECMRDVEMSKLELDCVEEKRKITDPICVKYNVGFNMDTKTKYKILAQATDENRNEYLALLWKDGTAPTSIRKYVLRKNILLTFNQKMLELNRTCEKMFKENESETKIAKFYLKEKEKLEKEFNKKNKQMKNLRQV